MDESRQSNRPTPRTPAAIEAELRRRLRMELAQARTDNDGELDDATLAEIIARAVCSALTFHLESPEHARNATLSSRTWRPAGGPRGGGPPPPRDYDEPPRRPPYPPRPPRDFDEPPRRGPYPPRDFDEPFRDDEFRPSPRPRSGPGGGRPFQGGRPSSGPPRGGGRRPPPSRGGGFGPRKPRRS